MSTPDEAAKRPVPSAVMVPVKGPSATELAHKRSLQFVMRLYEIGDVLGRFESLPTTLPAVVAILARALPLHTVILLGTFHDEPEAFVWRAPGETEVAYVDAKMHARDAYTYLMGPKAPAPPDLEAHDPLRTAIDAAAPVLDAEPTMLVALPLILTRGAVFGMMQLGAAAHLDEQDLVFIASAVHQVAVALDRSTSREALARSRAMLAGIVGIVSDAIVALDASQRIVIFNEGAASLFGCSQQEALGAPLSRILAPAEETYVRGFSADASRLGDRLEMIQVPRDGQERRVELVLSKMAIDGRRVVALIARDVTERKRLEKAEQLLSEAVHAREDLLAAVAHDVRSPLGNILLSTSMLLTVPEQDAPSARKNIERVQRLAGRIDRLIADLLDASTMEGGRFSIEPVRMEIAPLLTYVLETQRPNAESMGLRLLSEIAPDLPAVHADTGRLEQVLDNLLGNAIKFTASGGTITLRAERAGGMIRVSVRDTGLGIPRAELPHLFDRFWQARRTTRIGAGLGLFLVKGIVAAHGGAVGVESKVGEGTTFSFTVPLADPAAAPPKIPPLKTRRPPRRGS